MTNPRNSVEIKLDDSTHEFSMKINGAEIGCVKGFTLACEGCQAELKLNIKVDQLKLG